MQRRNSRVHTQHLRAAAASCTTMLLTWRLAAGMAQQQRDWLDGPRCTSVCQGLDKLTEALLQFDAQQENEEAQAGGKDDGCYHVDDIVTVVPRHLPSCAQLNGAILFRLLAACILNFG